METLKQKVNIPKNHHIKIEVPEKIPVGEAEILIIFESKNKNKKRKFGSGKGMIWISDDFNSPLDDFKEYME